MAYFIDEARDLAVAQIPKAGIQSFKEWLGPSFSVVANDDPALQTVTRRIAFIREPEDRLKSCFSFMFWMAEYGRPHSSNPVISDWQAFVDHILDPATPVNEHWAPQVTHIGTVATTYHRFENLGDHWETYRPGYLPHNNRTSRRPTPDYRISELASFYAEDRAIWLGAT
jgi:hypothetical protein